LRRRGAIGRTSEAAVAHVRRFIARPLESIRSSYSIRMLSPRGCARSDAHNSRE
jgi:hypothetical protein